LKKEEIIDDHISLKSINTLNKLHALHQ